MNNDAYNNNSNKKYIKIQLIINTYKITNKKCK